MVALSRARRSWWGIPALLLIAVVILTVIAYSYADCRYIYQLELEHYRSSASQAQQAPRQPTPLPITMTVRAGGRLVSTLASWLLWSGALYLVAVLLGRNEASFASIWKLVLWASVPYVIRGVAQSAFMLIAGKPIYNQALSGLVIDNAPPPMMTFQYVIPTKEQLALASLLEQLDVYLVWHLTLLVIGMTALTQLPRRKAAAVTVGIWVVFALLGMIPDFFPGTFSRFRYF